MAHIELSPIVTHVRGRIGRFVLRKNGENTALGRLPTAALKVPTAAQLEVQTRLFRDGQQVTAGTPAAPNNDGQTNTQRLIGVGRLQLNQIPAGDYVLQVIVTDKLASAKDRIAAQSMDFEVRQ